MPSRSANVKNEKQYEAQTDGLRFGLVDPGTAAPLDKPRLIAT